MNAEKRRIEDLEERVQHLEERVRMLFEIAIPDRHPFTYLALEYNLTKAEVKAILDLMDEVRKTLKTAKPMNHHEFEEKVYDIVPSQRRNYHFAEEIVDTLNESNQYQDVYNHMKKDGMNI